MKKNVVVVCILFVFLSLFCSCGSKKDKAIKIAQEACIAEYPSVKIKDAVKKTLLSPEISAVESLDSWLVTFKGNIDNKLFDGLFKNFDIPEIAYTFNVDIASKKVKIDKFTLADEKINTNTEDFDFYKKVFLAILFNDEKTLTDTYDYAISDCLDIVPEEDEYVIGTRKILDWNTDLGIIKALTCDDIPVEVQIDFAFGFEQGDFDNIKKFSDNIEKVALLINDFIKTKSSDEIIDVNNEEALTSDIKNLINDRILDDNGIKDIEIIFKDVILND